MGKEVGGIVLPKSLVEIMHIVQQATSKTLKTELPAERRQSKRSAQEPAVQFPGGPVKCPASADAQDTRP